MIRRLSEGVLEDIEGLSGISGHVSSEGGKHMPYVRIDRKDGRELHVHCTDAPLDSRAEAIKVARERAEEMIKVATASASDRA